jgi:bZIP transcription factor
VFLVLFRKDRKKSSYIKNLIQFDKKHGAELEVEDDDILVTRGLRGSHYGDDSESMQRVKKAKNRESAKNSRERKRVYFKLLEDKFFSQEQVIEDLRKQLSSMREGYTPIDIPQKATKLKSMQWSQKLEKSQMSIDTDIRDYQVDDR